MKKSISLLLLSLCLVARADIVGSTTTKIIDIFAYSEYGNGDVTVRVATPVVGCDAGYFLQKSDPGFNATLALLMNAKAAQTDVVVYGKTEVLWTGSAGKYCKLYGVNLR